MPPPGVPNWLFPSVVAYPFTVEPEALDLSVWVEAIGSRNGEIFVRFRNLVGPEVEGQLLISRRARTLSLTRFLAGYSSASLHLPNPPEEPALIPVPYRSGDEDQSEEMATGETNLPAAVPPPEPEPDRMGLLAVYLSLCLVWDRFIVDGPSLSSMTRRVRDQLGLTRQSQDNPDIYDPLQEVLSAIGDLLPPEEEEKPEVEPTSRFEREPPV
jgi:hypothetical protein